MLTNRLCKACEEGNVEEVNWLLESGASPNFSASGSSHWYPLHYAAANGHVDVVKVLLKNHAAIDPLESVCAWTPLMVTSIHISKSVKHLDVFVELLVAGANVEIQDARNNTIVHILSSLGRVSVLRKLFDAYPNLDPLGPGFGYLTPLHYATEAGHIETVRFFLEKGADIRCPDACGWTPLHWACRRGQKDMIDFLLSHGASLEDKDFRSLTPLDVAALFGHVGVAKLLDAQYLHAKVSLEHGEHNTSSYVGDTEFPRIDFGDTVGHIKYKHDADKLATTDKDKIEMTDQIISVNKIKAPSAHGRCLLLTVFGFLLCVISFLDYLYRANSFAVSFDSLSVFANTSKVNAMAVFSGLSLVAPALTWGVYCWRHLLNIGKWGARCANAAIGLTNEAHFRKNFVGALRTWACKERRNAVIPERINGGLRCKCTFMGLLSFLRSVFLVLVSPIKCAVALTFGCCAVFLLWTCGVLGVFVFKVVLIPTSALLQFLDILTFASSVRTVGDVRENRTDWDPSLRAAAEIRTGKSPSITKECGSQRAQPEEASFICDLFYPRSSAPLELIRKESPLQWKAANHPVYGCHHTEVVAFPENSVADDHQKCSDSLNQPYTARLNYTTATLYGSVPRIIHPCSFKTSNYKYCKTTGFWYGWRCKQRSCFKGDTRTANAMHDVASDSGVDVPVATLGQVMVGDLPNDPDTWKFHGSSGGLLAEAINRFTSSKNRSAIYSVEELCDASGSASSGVREPSHNTSTEVPGSTLAGLEELPPGGICHFAYKASVSSDLNCAQFSNSGMPVVKQLLATQKDDLDKSSGTDFPAMNPYGWLKRHSWKPYADKKYASSNTSIRSRLTRFSRPGIPGVFALKSLTKNSVIRDVPSEVPVSKTPRGFGDTASISAKMRLLFNRQSGNGLVRKSRGATCTSKGDLRRVRVLRRSRCKRIVSSVDGLDVEEVMHRRYLRVFDWYERLVANRYAEQKVLNRNSVQNPRSTCSQGNAILSEESCANGMPGNQPRVPNGILNWGDVTSLFAARTLGSKVDERPFVPWGTGHCSQECAGSELEENASLRCLNAEDIFDLPKPETAQGRHVRLSQALRTLLDSRECETQQSDASRVFVLQSNSPDYGHSVVGKLRNSNTSCSQSCGPRLPWNIHFRFRDMVEIPDMRKVFFNLWCREFERLLLYQERCFGGCPLWLGKSLEEESLSDFSYANLSSVITKSYSYVGKSDGTNAHAPADYNASRKVLWVLPDTTKTDSEPSEAAFQPKAAWCPECSGDIPGGVCICDGVPEPPMSCAFDFHSEQELLRKLTSLKRNEKPKSTTGQRRKGRACSDHGLVPEISEVSPGASPVQSTSFKPSPSQDTSLWSAECVSVRSICYSFVLFVIVVELFLGAMPLLIAVLLGWSLPMKAATEFGANDDQRDPSVAGSEILDSCNDTLRGATCVLFGYIFSLRSPMGTLCALKIVRNWSFTLLIPIWAIYVSIFFIHRVVVSPKQISASVR